MDAIRDDRGQFDVTPKTLVLIGQRDIFHATFPEKSVLFFESP